MTRAPERCGSSTRGRSSRDEDAAPRDWREALVCVRSLLARNRRVLGGGCTGAAGALLAGSGLNEFGRDPVAFWLESAVVPLFKHDGPIGRLSSAVTWFEERYCRADLRWLGVFRIFFGLLLTADLLRRWAVATDFYTNDGVLPNHFSLFRPLGRDVFSIYHAFSTLPEVSFAFALTLIVFLAFTVGYRTRLFHLLSLLCITSLNARNLLVENGGTVVMNLLCFWTVFMPLGRRVSIDALLRSLREQVEHDTADLNRRDSTAEPAQAFHSLVVFALMLQWSAIYFFNVVHKSGSGWHDGSAIHWFLYQDRIVTWFGIFAREHAPYWLLQGFTYGTLVVEGALAGILLVPFGQVGLRRLALVLAAGLHGGIAATSRLGPFSYAMTVFFIWRLSAEDWTWIARRFVAPAPTLRVIYDADCGICFQICRVLKRLDLSRRLLFIGNDQRELIPNQLSDELLDQTLVVIDGAGHQFLRERGVSAIVSALPLYGLGVGLLLRLPGAAWLARAAYSKVASRRHELSAQLGLAACGVPPVAPVPARDPAPIDPVSEHLWVGVSKHAGVAVREALVVAALLMTVNQILLDNDWARRHLPHPKQPEVLRIVVDRLRLYQGWRMFAPEPPYDDGRMVVDGRTVDGRKIDPFTGAEPEFDPETSVGWGHSQLWCDYHLKMYFARYAANRQHLKDYLQNWHLRTGHPQDRLVAFDVWWVNDKSPGPGETHGKPQKPVLLTSYGKVSDSGATPWLERGDGATSANP
ncbi:MAG TPA: DCC1-like thiol-disulfide oxidoreductase family protein [Polyangiaceae bacterium]|nr:DCC1-like thiol-disulfide oxidoreductase family protein [Polyangiaceae bacterium]